MKAAVAALACALALPLSARASTSSTLTSSADVTEGTLATREGKEVVPVPLEHTQVAIRVDGFLADVEVEQTFHNPYKEKIEAVYLFPLPTQAAVHDMTITVGDRVIQGEVKLRGEAKQVYKTAAAAGHVAALLTEERPNLFTQSVANLEPGARVVVKIRYVQSLAYEDGGYELVFPMVAGPRHVPPTSKLNKDEIAAVQPQVLPAGMRSAHDIGLTAEIDAGVPIQGIASTSHKIDVSTLSAHEAKVAIAAGDTIPNKDFILRYQVATKEGTKAPELAVVAHRGDAGDGSFFFLAQPPEQAAAEQVTPKEMVFVIDTSSSMQGAPLEKAKEAVRKALATMGPDDTFQIVRFDDAASGLGDKPIANKPKNVEYALAWLDALEAGGGTDMSVGISAALDFPHDPARLRIVAFLTDGYIGNEDEVLALVQGKLGASRLFSFGVGSAVNRYLLEEMATLGRGAVQVVRPDEDTTEAVEKFHKRIAQPLLTDIAIDWGSLAVKDVTPARVPDLFAGQPLVLSGRYTGGGSGTVTVSGMSAGRKVSFQVAVTLPDKQERQGVAAIWARSRIAELSREQIRGEKPEVKQQIIDLALANHLMTQYTAFVAVDASRVTAGGQATTVPVPVEVPDELRWASGYGSGGGGYGASVGYAGIGHGGGGDAMYYDAIEDGEVYGGTMTQLDAPQQGTLEKSETSTAARGRGDQPIVIPAAAPAPPADHAAAEPSKPAAADGTSKAKLKADVRKCYLASKKKGTGALGILLILDSRGRVADATVTGVDDAALTSCVTKAALTWSWDSDSGKSSVKLTYNLADME